MNGLKRWIGLALIILLLPIHAAAEEQASFYVVKAVDGATMTASANPNGMVVAKLKQGARVQLVRQEEQWTKVDYNGRLGWVSTERIAPFTEDLLPVYSSYYKQLQNTNDVIYALLADFTQDGVEDLYIIVDSNPAKGQYQEFIYSGDQVIYQKNRTSGVSVLQNGADYYIWHHAQTNADKKYKLANLNSQAKTDYYEASEGKGTYEITANVYLKSYSVLQSGDGAVMEQGLAQEQVASKDYYGAELANDYEESIYLENYTLSQNGETKSVLARQFNEQFSFYENSKVLKIIYEDGYNSAVLSSRFSFDVERVQRELLNLAQLIMPKNTAENEQDVSATEKEALQLKLAQSALLEIPYSEAIPRNAAAYFQRIEQAIPRGLTGSDTVKLGMTVTAQETTYSRDAVNALIYDFYGMKMDDAEFNRLANDAGYSVDGTLYYALTQETPAAAATVYRQWQDTEILDNGYVALKFEDFDMPMQETVTPENESALIAGTNTGGGYVLLKRLPFKAGTQFVYIDTVAALDGLDTSQYGTYENSLAAVQKYVGEQKTVTIEETPEQALEIEPAAQPQTGKPQQSNLWALLVGVILLITASGIALRKMLLKRKEV